MPSVLSHLAHGLASHPENVATEALAFILEPSEAARNGLARFVQEIGFSCNEPVRFRTEIVDAAGARPDLIGHALDGTARIVIEAKFWAGLTDAQPVAYFSSLPESAALLLFVAPAKRLETLWVEITRRYQAAGYSGVPIEVALKETRSVVIGGHILGLTSWRALLLGLGAAVEMAGDVGTAADVRQLIELCESMDSEGFLPITAEELTCTLGRRVIQFGQLASDLTDLLVANGRASVKGVRAAGGNGWYGRYLTLRGNGSFLHFNAAEWAARGLSPLWLRIMGPGWKPSPGVRAALVQGAVTFFDSDDGFYVPIELATGVEREEVLDIALRQLTVIADLLPFVLVEQGSPPDVAAET